MSTDPDQIRADIERTRSELSQDVDALGEKVSPSAAVERRKERLRDSVTSVKDRVMGSAHDVAGSGSDTAHGLKDSVSSRASDLGETAANVPSAVRRQTEGNPLAAGLIAFGVGWLAASLIPTSQKEQQAAVAAKNQAGGLVDGAKGAAQEVADHLREPAQDAAQAVKDRAAEAAAHLQEEGRSEADGLKDQAAAAKENVQDQRGQ